MQTVGRLKRKDPRNGNRQFRGNRNMFSRMEIESMKWTMMVAVVCLCCEAQAQTYQARRATPEPSCRQSEYLPKWAVVQVASWRDDGTVMGTGIPVGTLPDGRRLILTANYCVDGQCPTRIGAGGGLNVPARVVATDARYDVALLTADVPPEHPLQDMPLPPEGQPGPSGDSSWGGFVPDESQYRQFETPAPEAFGPARFWTPGRAELGMSGGPVYSVRPCVLRGMIVARGLTRPVSLAVNSDYLRGFLASVLPPDQLRYVASSQPLRPNSRNWQRIAAHRLQPVTAEWSQAAHKTRSNSIFR